MNRMQIVLAALVAVLLIVVFWLVLWSPKQDELEQVRADIEMAQSQQAQLTNELNQLRTVREQAPELEAELAAASAVVPNDTALPSALRQLQRAADESRVTLRSVAPSQPAQVEEAAEGVSMIEVNVQVDGSYFQLVDFLRRIEDPSISPRGLLWSNLTVAREEYPTLNATLSGQMFSHLPAPPSEDAADAGGSASDDAEAPEAEDDAGADGDEDAPDTGDVDADVEEELQ